jgi:hypothetical protein
MDIPARQYLDDRGYALDLGNNTPRASRVLSAGDRDAAVLHWPERSNPTRHKASRSGATKSTQPIIAPWGGLFTLGLAAGLHLIAVI